MSDTSADIEPTGTVLARSDGSRFAAYFALLKPRVMSLVVFTALVGLMLAPGEIHGVAGLAALLAIALGAGASGALNMWYDADIDAKMQRTQNRPIPTGRVGRDAALALGTILSVLSVLLLGLVTNWIAAGLLAATIGYYLFIYTMWLKRRTPQNIVIGGAAGAFPPMIGWAAVTGSVSLESLVLFAIIFLWTPPHFWALALYRTDDYERVQIPMLPVVAGPDATRAQMLAYTLILVPVTLLPVLMEFAGWIYALTAVCAGGAFIVLAFRVYTQRFGGLARRCASQMFGFSILYLFTLFAVLLIERIVSGTAWMTPGGV